MTLNWSIAFLVVAILAGLLGCSTLFGSLVWMAQVLSGVFLALFVWSFVARRKRLRPFNSDLNR